MPALRRDPRPWPYKEKVKGRDEEKETGKKEGMKNRMRKERERGGWRGRERREGEKGERSKK